MRHDAASRDKRLVTTVAPQALTLFNGDFVNRQAKHFADRLVKEAGDDAVKQIERAYRLALCRPPTPNERDRMSRFMEQEAESLLADARQAGTPLPEANARRKALEQLCRVIFNLNEFVYSD